MRRRRRRRYEGGRGGGWVRRMRYNLFSTIILELTIIFDEEE